MIVVQGVVRSLFQSLGLILAYLALEPLQRRLWPDVARVLDAIPAGTLASRAEWA